MELVIALLHSPTQPFTCRQLAIYTGIRGASLSRSAGNPPGLLAVVGGPTNSRANKGCINDCEISKAAMKEDA